MTERAEFQYHNINATRGLFHKTTYNIFLMHKQHCCVIAFVARNGLSVLNKRALPNISRVEEGLKRCELFTRAFFSNAITPESLYN